MSAACGMTFWCRSTPNLLPLSGGPGGDRSGATQSRSRTPRSQADRAVYSSRREAASARQLQVRHSYLGGIRAVAVKRSDQRHRRIASSLCWRGLLLGAVAPGRGHPLTAHGPVRPADLAGYEVVTFDRSRYPALFDRRFGPLSSAGARLVNAPDNMPDAVGAFALDRGLVSLVPCPSRLRPKVMRFCYARWREPPSTQNCAWLRSSPHWPGPALQFWSRAERMAAEQ